MAVTNDDILDLLNTYAEKKYPKLKLEFTALGAGEKMEAQVTIAHLVPFTRREALENRGMAFENLFADKIQKVLFEIADTALNMT